jgi:RNA polymerase sigma-70 factor (ECF subfamily)
MERKGMQEARRDGLEELFHRASAGDRRAFDQFVRSSMTSIVALTYRMTGDRDTALDLAQETFVTAWEKRESFRGDGSVLGWLLRIASNKCMNFLSRERQPDSSGDILEEIAATDPNPERLLEQKALTADLQAFVQSLPPQQRLAFELRFGQQLAFDEAAKIAESAVTTVKTNYQEAIKKLRQYARERGWL